MRCCLMCRGFNESLHSLCPDRKFTTKLSSAGLVYFHFGHQVLAELTGTTADDKLVQTLYDKVYENFIEEVDGIDNGIDPCSEKPRLVTEDQLFISSQHILL